MDQCAKRGFTQTLGKIFESSSLNFIKMYKITNFINFDRKKMQKSKKITFSLINALRLKQEVNE